MATNDGILEDYSGDGISYGEDPVFSSEDSVFIDFGSPDYDDSFFEDEWVYDDFGFSDDSDQPGGDWGGYSFDLSGYEDEGLLGESSDDSFAQQMMAQNVRNATLKNDLLEQRLGDGKESGSWWEAILNNKDMMKGFTTMFGMGLKAYQADKDRERADETAKKDYDRKKDWALFQEDLRKQRYAGLGGGGGGSAPDTSYKYTPGIKTGTFNKK